MPLITKYVYGVLIVLGHSQIKQKIPLMQEHMTNFMFECPPGLSLQVQGH